MEEYQDLIILGLFAFAGIGMAAMVLVPWLFSDHKRDDIIRWWNWLRHWRQRREEKRRRLAEWAREREEFSAKLKAEKEAWERKIAHARRLLTGDSWRDPVGKEEFVHEVYDGKIPGYLWYALGEKRLTREDCKEIAKFFWGESVSGFGDLEFHGSYYSAQGVTRALRIRDPKRFAAELVVGDAKYPLYQTGVNQPFFETYGDKDAAILFLGLYEEEVPVQ